MIPPRDLFSDQPFCLPEFACRLVALASHEPIGRPVGEAGGVYQWDRLEVFARWMAESMAGDFCEIGCYAGGMTVRLAALARKYGRRVIAIDPFPAGTPYRLAEEVRGVFTEAIQPWPEIEWHEVDGNDARAVEAALAGRRLCFGFADATKEHEHVRAQLAGLMGACDGLIAVDDAYVIDVVRAADERARESEADWCHVRVTGVRETWLARRPR